MRPLHQGHVDHLLGDLDTENTDSRPSASNANHNQGVSLLQRIDDIKSASLLDLPPKLQRNDASVISFGLSSNLSGRFVALDELSKPTSVLEKKIADHAGKSNQIFGNW